MRVSFLLPALLALGVTGAHAETIAFDKSWKKQGFFNFFSNKYDLRGSKLGVSSDGTVSLIYRAAPETVQSAKKAAWNWAVSQTVPTTNLLKKGGDDRNLALYFVFADQATAKALKGKSAARLLSNKNVKAISYIWGGDLPKGKVFDSPYSPSSLKIISKRGAMTGSFGEEVNLAADYKRAYGVEPDVLLGLAITADSDDTDSMIQAEISNLKLF